MSLVRLLTSGKSLVSFKDSSGHYRMQPKNLLPKFGSARNPFANGSPQPVQAEIRPAPCGISASVMKAPATVQTEASQSPAIVSQEPNEIEVRAKAWSRISITLSAWTKRLNPRTWRAKLGRPAKPAIPRFSKAPVQGELSLDNVRVVRNDLSEADLEIVVTKSMGGKAASERTEQTEATGELLKA